MLLILSEVVLSLIDLVDIVLVEADPLQVLFS